MKRYTNPIRIHFDELPFYWKPLDVDEDTTIPETLPFALIVNEMGIVAQIPSIGVKNAIERAYKLGSWFPGNMNNGEIGSSVASDVLSIIKDTAGELRNKQCLEIGCGNGYLMKQIMNLGATIIGYEPGYDRVGEYPNLNVVQDFFPTHHIEAMKFDIIVACAVIEHASDPVQLLNSISTYLSDGGIIIIGAIDCAEHIECGDISMLAHVHNSYFTAKTINTLVRRCGFSIDKMLGVSDTTSGSMYIALSKTPSQTTNIVDDTDIMVFDRIEQSIETFRSFIRSQAGKSIGIYAPIRALNMLFMLRNDILQNKVTIRMFDDDMIMHKKCLPGMREIGCNTVESVDDLVRSPCEVVLIFSRTYSSAIIQNITRKGYCGNIVRICDLI